MRLAIAVPCHVYVAPQMAQSLSAMSYRLGQLGYEVALRFLGNASSTFGRNELVRWAKRIKADYLLWVDTDSVFPPDAVERLLYSGYPFVGANFSMKQKDGESSCSDLVGNRLAPQPDGIQRVSELGMGLTLMRMDVLDAVGEPWFALIDGALDGPNDDGRFCRLATAAGFGPRVDHRLSSECSHVGFTEYRLPIPVEA